MCGSKHRVKLLLSAAQEKRELLYYYIRNGLLYNIFSEFTVQWILTLQPKPSFTVWAEMSHERQTDVRVWRLLDGLMNADQVGGFDAGPRHIRSHSSSHKYIFDFHARSLEWKDNKTTFTPQMEETQTWLISGSFSHITARLTWNQIFLIQGCFLMWS